MRSILTFSLVALAAGLSPQLHAQSLVYSQPAVANATYPYLSVATGTEYGSAIRLGGTDRDLQSATLAVYSSMPRTVTLTLSLYATTPETRYPATGSTSAVANLRPLDTPLWTSGPQTFQLTGGGGTGLSLNSLVFSGLNTLAPDNLFWAVTFNSVSNATTGAYGPKLADPTKLTPAGAANDPGHLYQRTPGVSGGVWTPSTFTDTTGSPRNAALSLSLTAVPESSAALLAAGGIAAVGLRRRRRAA